ncbi:MAG: hypothetical protein OXC26_00770 [Albidovulum sp.]|nr:hypothetical protein [Albidovulum sp.]
MTDFEPENYAEVSSVVETEQVMLEAHESRNSRTNAPFDEDLTALTMRHTAFRGLAIGTRCAEGFRSLRTYPVTDPMEILP